MGYSNKEDRYAQQARHRKKNFDKLWAMLLESKCVDCGESDPIVLEFDHLPDFEKKFDIARAISGSTRSWALIKSEIDKCDIVCANCHRKRTAKRGLWQRHTASLLEINK